MKRIAIVLAALLIIGSITGYYIYRRNQASIPQVKVIKVGRAMLESKVYATGKIDTAAKQEVRVLAPSLIRNIPVSVGSKVKKGELLVELDSTEVDLQIKQAQASLDVAKANAAALETKIADLEKIQSEENVPAQALPDIPGLNPGLSLPGNQGIPDLSGLENELSKNYAATTLKDLKSSRVQAQAMVKQAQTALELLQSQKKKTRITASIDGTVLAVNGAVNQPAVSQVPVVLVGDLDHLVLMADVNEVDAGKLAVGQRVKITGTTLGDREFSGKVASVAPMAQTLPSIQGSQTTVSVKIEADQADPAMKPGFSVSLAITTISKPNVLQVPLEAVFTQDKDKYLYVVRNDVLAKVKVTTGISGDVNNEITSGLNEGDAVVINPSKNLQEGMKVRVE